MSFIKIEKEKRNPNNDVLVAWKWAILAKARTSEGTYAIDKVRIEPGVIVALDGRRLHAWEFEHDYETGFYNVLSDTQNSVVLAKIDESKLSPMEKLRFPEWKILLLDKQGATAVRLYRTGRAPFDRSIAKLFRNTPENQAFNLSFLKDALGFVTYNEAETTLYVEGPERPIQIETKVTNIGMLTALVHYIDL
ncbi:MAG: hypothetical protein PHW65_05380 [Dehalococcoidales bacterium]|nr:hypothetical protein [Dehalococcoidales bacterium]